MTELHLVPVLAEAPVRLRHLPTEVDAMRFTPATRWALYRWLAADLGREHFEMTDTHLVIETRQGDSRNAGLGDWAIRRPTRQGFEFYPVEADVVEDSYYVPKGAA